jgi:hypothetical protein
MKYESFRYLWPPRPETKIAPTDLGVIESMGWWGQAKFNGTCTVIYVPAATEPFPGGSRGSVAMGRHGPDHVLDWQPGASWQAFEATLDGGWHVFVGELLHSKGVGVKDTIVLFDMLVEDGDYLVGKTLYDRFNRLERLLKAYNSEPQIKLTHREYNQGVWLVENRARAFRLWFDAEAPAMVEGLCFKDKNAKLRLCSRSSANSGGQVKCRKPKANVSF